MDLKKLQNGSEIRGVAMPGIPGEDVNLNTEAVEAIAGGFVRWLRAKVPEGTALRISIGRDSRISGPAIAETLTTALCRAGAEVTDLGLATTPAMFMSTVLPRRPFTAAIMITASHLPWNRNGLKFFTARGGAESADIKEILTLAGEAFPAAETTGRRKRAVSWKPTLRFCAKRSPTPPESRVLWRGCGSLWTRATGRAASSQGRCWNLWAQTRRAAAF